MKVYIYKVKIYDFTKDEFIVSRRMATETGAAIMGGIIISETRTLIDSSELEQGQQWTVKDFVPGV